MKNTQKIKLIILSVVLLIAYALASKYSCEPVDAKPLCNPIVMDTLN
mgnify:CR=1